MCSRMRLSGSFDYSAIAKKTPGYVGADLSSLTKEAAVVAINRIFRYTYTAHQSLHNH
jgi:ribosome biogenesis ATPase